MGRKVMAEQVPILYQQHYVDKGFERLGIFVLLAEHFAIRSALYPGSFTHVTPAFVFPVTCFVDTDRRAARFFRDPSLMDFVNRRKSYVEEPLIRFHHADYAHSFAEDDETFDLLISQYAGFVSQHCKRYLRIGGHLLANNSHGDAGMAAIDPDYTLVAVIHHRGERYALSESGLGAYFVPKRDLRITRVHLEQVGKGIGYTRSAFAYVFRRVS
jgi:hypothetical protein